jgi:hypothetical protein
MSNKRSNSGEINVLHKKCNANNNIMISIDHNLLDDFKEIKDINKDLSDKPSDIKFIVDNEEFVSHSEVLNLFSSKRQLVKDLIEKDQKLAQKQNCEKANIFQMSGTTPQAFANLLKYIYTGIVEFDPKNGIDLALTAYKLKFNSLVDSIASELNKCIDNCLNIETVDDLYHISKCAKNYQLMQECARFMDNNALQMKELFLKKDIQETDGKNVLTIDFDKSRYNNYIHFLLPENDEICFNVFISNDRKNWALVLQNEEIWSKSWNWFYFKEQRLKYIRIVCTEKESDNQFEIQDLREEFFLCKRANIVLNFDPLTKYLIPKHDIIKYPLIETKHYFDEKQTNGFTYCMSDAPKKEKERFYYYHIVGDGKSLEFYLPQTCLIDSIRFRLWDLDDRTYDFKVQIKHNEEDDWHTIKDANCDVFRRRKSWQTIEFGRLRTVRWIQITGIKSPPNDSEFAIIHFECPKQTNIS